MKLIKDELAVQDFWLLVPKDNSPLWPVICIDFNGVIDTYDGWPGYVRDYAPAEGVHNFLKELRKYFNTIVVFTATIPLTTVKVWLEVNNLDPHVDFLTNWKLPAVVYIDDKAVCHRGDFDETLEQAISFKAHWEE